MMKLPLAPGVAVLEDQIFSLLQIFIQLENQLITALQVLLVPRETLRLVPASWEGPWWKAMKGSVFGTKHGVRLVTVSG
eukprot:Skav212372  [mRNA]  locus=scaffold1983:55353:55589:- [translate_table: standard]